MGYQSATGVMFAPTVRNGNGNHMLRVLLPTVSRRIGAEGGSWWLDRMISAIRARMEVSNGRLVEQHFPTIDALIEEFQRSRFHGVVLRQPLPHAWIERLLKVGPVVYAVEFDHQLNVDSVYSNEHRSAAMVLDHLSIRNHRQIAWLGILDRHAPYQVVFRRAGRIEHSGPPGLSQTGPGTRHGRTLPTANWLGRRSPSFSWSETGIGRGWTKWLNRGWIAFWRFRRKCRRSSAPATRWRCPSSSI